MLTNRRSLSEAKDSMQPILLGHEVESGEEVCIDRNAFKTHFHLIGGTGKGKTTAVHTMLQPLLCDPFNKACFVIIDRLGNFSQELLLWMSSRFCPSFVSKRLVYIEPAREDIVATFNPLKYTTPGHCYYQVERTTEIILRAWESMNIEAMPRLARWTFNSFFAAAQLGLTVSDCTHLLMPGSDLHPHLMKLLPKRLQAEWAEIMNPRASNEAMRILESTRNRLKPYFDSDILRRMFGAADGTLDFLRFMQEGKIVLINLFPKNRLGGQLANTVGGLIINEIIAQIRSVPLYKRLPTYMLLDEFQNFVGPDLESALPELRGLGLHLMLSHQSLSQLKRGDFDMTGLIWQAQSRMIFGVQGEDADILANEVASLMYDPEKIEQEIYSHRQRIVGYSKETLSSWGETEAAAQGWASQYGVNLPKVSETFLGERPLGSDNRSDSSTGGSSNSKTRGGHEVFQPIHEDFQELASRSFVSFDKQRSLWAKKIRRLHTGTALVRLVNEDDIREVAIKKSTPGVLQYDMNFIAQKFPEAIQKMERMMDENFSSDIFRPAADVDREAEDRLRKILFPTINVREVTPEEPSEPTEFGI